MEIKHTPQPNDPTQRLLDLGFDLETVQALELRSAIWALASEFSSDQCDLTHSETVSSDGRINQVVICLNLIANSYYDFAEYLSNHAAVKLLPTERVSVAIGFNYGRPGLIEIKQGVVGYFPDKDILDIPDTSKLTYGQGEAREVIGQLEDKVWEKVRK